MTTPQLPSPGIRHPSRTALLETDDTQAATVDAAGYIENKDPENLATPLSSGPMQKRHITNDQICAMQDLAIASDFRIEKIALRPIVRASKLSTRRTQPDTAASVLGRQQSASSSPLSDVDEDVVGTREEGISGSEEDEDEAEAEKDVKRPSPRISIMGSRRQAPSSHTRPAGTRRPPLATEPALSAQRQTMASKSFVETFDTAYVNERPGRTFHHLGRGRWAKGMPPPGSSVKMGVRGPGLAAWKAQNAK